MRAAEFVRRCRRAVGEPDAAEAVRDLVQWLVQNRDAVLEEIGSATRSAIDPVYVGDDLTILHVVMPPTAVAGPHDHSTWAVVGVHGGTETNELYERSGDGSDIVKTGRVNVEPGETLLLSPAAIHAVSNGNSSYAAAIHVYGGNLLQTPRSAWDATGVERDLDDTEQRAAVLAFQREEAGLGRALTLGEAQRLLSSLRDGAR